MKKQEEGEKILKEVGRRVGRSWKKLGGTKQKPRGSTKKQELRGRSQQEEVVTSIHQNDTLKIVYAITNLKCEKHLSKNTLNCS